MTDISHSPTRRKQLFLFGIFALLAIAIGLYPIMYVFIGTQVGLLSSKAPELLGASWYLPFFYAHIGFGGLALLSGWSQFSGKFREKKLNWHRTLGKIYLISVLLSGISSIIIAPQATGGWIASSGFLGLGITWIVTSLLAYLAIRKGEVESHQRWIIFSYAACFAAVTLRLWLPSLSALLEDFVTAYRITAWLCWVPNIAVAFWLTRKS